MTDNRIKQRASQGKDDLVSFWSSGPGLISAAVIGLGTIGFLIYNIIVGISAAQ